MLSEPDSNPPRPRRRRRRKAQVVEAPAHLGYRFDGVEGSLALRRVLVRGRQETPISGSLAETLAAPESAAGLELTDFDRRVDTIMGSYTGGPIPTGLMARLLDALGDAPDLGYHGRAARTGKPTAGLCVRVQAYGNGVRLLLAKDPLVAELFNNGALRRGIKFRALESHRLGERRYRELRVGQVYEECDFGTLVGDILPKLQLELPVLYDTDKLPKTKILAPHLAVASTRDGDGLTLLATLNYGDPPRARLQGERLVLLSAGPAPVRDVEAELPLRRISDELGLDLNIKRTFYGTQALAAARRLDGVRHVWITGLAHLDFYDAGPITAHLDIQPEGDFELWFEPVGVSPSQSDGPRVDAKTVMCAWERNDPLVPLLGGGFSRLPEDWLTKFGHRVRDLLSAREQLQKVNEASLGAGAQPSSGARYLLPDLAALAEALNQPPPPSFRKLRKIVDSFAGIPKARLPAGVKAKLRNYQRLGVDWLSFLRDTEMGALLADDMGLGKTLQTLCVIKGRTLVVAPTSVLHNWQAEVERFRPSLQAKVYHGVGRTLDPKAKVTLTTYALLRLDAEMLAKEKWDMVVLDEAQAIKNPASQVAKAGYGLQARFKVVLTGTPIENRLEDLWSQFHFLNPGLLGGRNDFHERYVKPIAAGDDDAAERLRRRIRPFILRRMKSEVAKELPPRTEVVLHCVLSDAERQVYDAVRAATRAEVAKKLSANSANTLAVLEALLRLRQAACHPALLPGQKSFKGESSSKLDLLKELLDAALAEGHKAIVFSQWTSLLDLAVQELDKAGIAHIRLDGRTRNRKKVVSDFQSPDGPPVMLVSLKAGGTGLNLTAADHVILLDPWWNPAVEDQAADRAHRIGQKRPVIVHRLVAEDTVEDRILKLQEAKRAVAKTALARGKAGKAVTREELLALLE